MSFFESLNDKFFNPFCCRNRAVYFDCISQLIEKSKEIPLRRKISARRLEMAAHPRKMLQQSCGISGPAAGLHLRKSAEAETILPPCQPTAGSLLMPFTRSLTGMPTAPSPITFFPCMKFSGQPLARTAPELCGRI